MEKLLKWSVDAQEKGMNAPPPDPEQLAKLFGAPDDIALMHTEMQVAANTDNSQDLETRIDQLEAFHDHVENVDNANNIGKLWPYLIALIDDKEVQIRQLALTSISAAVQNNEKSQMDLVNQEGAISKIMARAEDKFTSKEALLAISSAVGHCTEAYKQFADNNGWDMLKKLSDTYLSTDKELVGTQGVKGRLLSVFASLSILIEDRPDIAPELRKFEPVLLSIQKKESGNNKEKVDTVITNLGNAKPVQQISN